MINALVIEHFFYDSFIIGTNEFVPTFVRKFCFRFPVDTNSFVFTGAEVYTLFEYKFICIFFGNLYTI